MNSVDHLRLFMEPRSVALIGVSRRTGIIAWNIMENLLNQGYEGKVYPVNPNADEILGRKCYPTVKDIPESADLAVISTPRDQVPEVVRDCVEKGIKAITVVAQGFADADAEGKQMQSEIVRIAREGGARIIGPNTFGTANAFTRFSSAFVPLDMKEMPVGIICQTGIFMAGIPRLPMIGKGIDLGNAADIDFADALEYFEHDPQVRVIMIHMEGTRNGARFMEVARRVSRKKPVLVLKTGRGEQSVRAMQSHTGTLAGSDAVYDAVFTQCGMIRVNDIDEFDDFSRAFLRLPLMKGDGFAVITIAGAGGIMAIDAGERYGLHIATPQPQTLERIAGLAPSWQRLDNPADIWPAIMIEKRGIDEVFYGVTDAFLADSGIHGIIVISHAAFLFAAPDIFRRGNHNGKPVVCWLYGSGMEKMIAGLEEKGETVFFPTLDRAVRTLSRLRRYHQHVNGGGE